MNVDDLFNDGDKFELEAAISAAAQEHPTWPRHKLVAKVLRPTLRRTLGDDRAKWAERWLLRNVDVANDIPPEEYLEVLGEVARLLDIIERHIPENELDDDEVVSLMLAKTLASLSQLTEDWKKP